MDEKKRREGRGVNFEFISSEGRKKKKKALTSQEILKLNAAAEGNNNFLARVITGDVSLRVRGRHAELESNIGD